MRRARGLRLAVALASLTFAAAGCRPLYLPPVPEAPPIEEGVRVAVHGSGLNEEGRPSLELEVVGGGDGWLAVQWMAPSGREAASGSVWVTAAEPVAEFVLPGDVELTSGEWRAVVSLGGRLLRQFTFTIEQ